MAHDPESVLTRGASDPDLVVAYGPDPQHVCDVWWPGSAQPADPAPLVLLIHGGFWQPALAGHGYIVGLIEYARLRMPGGGWPGTFDDIAAALDRVPQMINDVVGQELAPPVLVGHSAGGHLALWAAARHRLPITSSWRLTQPTKITGVVALAPVACLGQADRDGVGDGAVAELLGFRPRVTRCLLPPLDLADVLVERRR